jgi:hypothetical protein
VAVEMVYFTIQAALLPQLQLTELLIQAAAAADHLKLVFIEVATAVQV